MNRDFSEITSEAAPKFLGDIIRTNRDSSATSSARTAITLNCASPKHKKSMP
jgi:hypothetical protein